MLELPNLPTIDACLAWIVSAENAESSQHFGLAQPKSLETPNVSKLNVRFPNLALPLRNKTITPCHRDRLGCWLLHAILCTPLLLLTPSWFGTFCSMQISKSFDPALVV